MQSLVFVCWGNICRSPMAERVARRRAAERGMELDVASFGLSPEELHNPIDRRAARVLAAAGYETGGHRGRQITAADVSSADLVVVVEPYMVEHLQEVAPGARNIRLLNDYNSRLPRGTALQDPWYGPDDGFAETLADIEAAMPAILDELEGLA